MPRVGATVGTSKTWLSSWMIDSAQARPRTAVRMGSAIAVTVPNVKSRMITAAVRPTASLLSVLGLDSCLPT